MPNELQERIRARAAAKDEEGTEANPSIIDLEEAARGTPLAKRRKGSARVVPTQRSRLRKATSVNDALAKAAASAGPRSAATPLHKNSGGSLAAEMLDDLGRLLEVFRAEEGRDPTEDDLSFWQAFAHTIRNRLGK